MKELTEVDGVGITKAITILSAIELGKRIFINRELEAKIFLNSSKKIYDYMRYQLLDKKQEYFYCLYLNQKKELIERKLLFMGTINRKSVADVAIDLIEKYNSRNKLKWGALC